MIRNIVLAVFLVSAAAAQMPMGGVTVSYGGGGGGNPQIRCNAYYTTASASYNANFCAGTTAGDLVVVLFENGYNLNSNAPPSGWSPIMNDTSTSAKIGGFFKNVTSSDITTGYVTLAFANGYNANIAVITFNGATGGFREMTYAVSGSNSATLALPNTTSAVLNSDTMIYWGAYRSGSGSITFSRGTALNSGTTADGIGADAYEYLTSGGPLAATVNFGSTGHGAGGFQVAIRATAPTYNNTFAVFPNSTTSVLRNNITGTVGGAFTPPNNITVYGLGRLYVAGNTGNHTAYIWDTGTSLSVASCTILAATASDAYNYKYCLLGSPVALTGGHAYRISIDETSGGDNWLDSGASYVWNLNAPFSYTQSYYNGTTQGAYPATSGTGVMYDSLAIEYQ